MDGCEAASPGLASGAVRLGFKLSEVQQERFIRYCRLLHQANQRFNLTAIRTPDGIMRTLFLDSLTVAAALPPGVLWEENLRAVDVGAGAGLPGLPLAILHPAWTVTLIESTGKKARFLEEAARELGLPHVEVLAARAEAVGVDPFYRDHADLCTARAVAPLATLLELSTPLVRSGGYLAFPKSGEVQAEIAGARTAAERLRIRLLEVRPVPEELGLGTGRATVLYVKEGPTPAGYPRRIGLARSRPIGAPPPPRVPREREE